MQGGRWIFRLLLVAVLAIRMAPLQAEEGGPAPDSLEEETGEEVDLELVLAVDVSFSVDGVEARTQREGYINALTHPSVLDAISAGYLGRIALTYVEWADTYQQYQIVDWSVISDRASAEAFVQALREQPFTQGYRTSISHAIDYAAALFDKNGFRGLRRVIDISGDGPHNRGRPLAAARQAALDRGITINGLPILNDRTQPWGFGTPRQENLDLYYRDNVIGGPGAFMIAAEDFEAFRAAILSKLIREIAGREEERTGRHARLVRSHIQKERPSCHSLPNPLCRDSRRR